VEIPVASTVSEKERVVAVVDLTATKTGADLLKDGVLAAVCEMRISGF
jgi:hypothetical protein